MFGLVNQKQTIFYAWMCAYVLMYVEDICMGSVPMQTRVEDKALPAALCRGVCSVFAWALALGSIWQLGLKGFWLTARRCSMDSQSLIASAHSDSHFWLVKNDYSWYLLWRATFTGLEFKFVTTSVFIMGNYFPFLCSSTVMSFVIDNHKTVTLFIIREPWVCPRTNPTVFGNRTWRHSVWKLFCTDNSLYHVQHNAPQPQTSYYISSKTCHLHFLAQKIMLSCCYHCFHFNTLLSLSAFT